MIYVWLHYCILRFEIRFVWRYPENFIEDVAELVDAALRYLSN